MATDLTIFYETMAEGLNVDPKDQKKVAKTLLEKLDLVENPGARAVLNRNNFRDAMLKLETMVDRPHFNNSLRLWQDLSEEFGEQEKPYAAEFASLATEFYYAINFTVNNIPGVRKRVASLEDTGSASDAYFTSISDFIDEQDTVTTLGKEPLENLVRTNISNIVPKIGQLNLRGVFRYVFANFNAYLNENVAKDSNELVARYIMLRSFDLLAPDVPGFKAIREQLTK